MNPDVLFLRRCEQLAKLQASTDEIDLVDMAGILRQLLFDQKPLVDVVNKGLKLAFKVGVFSAHTRPENDPHWDKVTYLALNDGIDPYTSHHGDFVEVNRNKFGHHVVAFGHGHKVTIYDVVTYNANAKGAVHYDPKPKDKFAVIQSMEALSVGGYSAASTSLKAISRVTLRGLQPLIEAVKER